jgi:hypothetical protein
MLADLKNKKSDETGKIRVNELWSEKYSKMIMKESKIMKNL